MTRVGEILGENGDDLQAVVDRLRTNRGDLYEVATGVEADHPEVFADPAETMTPDELIASIQVTGAKE